MSRELYNLIINLEYYAKFLRTNNSEYAVKAVQDPRDKRNSLSGDEIFAAVETCRSQKQGKVALMRWRKKPTDIGANLAFIILSREEQNIPNDLLGAVTKNIEKWIDNYEDKKNTSDGYDFDEVAWQYFKLKQEISKRAAKITKDSIFKKYASEWGVEATEKSEPYEVLKERFKKRRRDEKKQLKRRLTLPNIRAREKKEILEELARKI